MANLEDPAAPCDVNELLKVPHTKPDFLLDGVHFGRGDGYRDETTSTLLKHTTTQLKRWRIVDENLEEIAEKLINDFYDSETYIIEWNFVTESFRLNTDTLLSKIENKIYFYWKGDSAYKGYSPLPEAIEKDNPSVERITQWAEPPVFLQLFSGTLIVHIAQHDDVSDHPRLYILRGEMENEIHLYEVPLKRENLRSRTSFVVFYPKEKTSIIWHGSKSNSHCRDAIKTATGKLFGSDFIEISEGSENDAFLKSMGTPNSVDVPSKIMDYSPRLFYFNKITGNFLASEIECSHKSPHVTPFPFLQAHLYSDVQPATFLLDDNDEIWMWQEWEPRKDETFKSECFETAINYAKQKSKLIKSLVRVHKVIAGFEPNEFINLFPTWSKTEDVAQLQMKDGVLPNKNQLIEVITHEDLQQ